MLFFVTLDVTHLVNMVKLSTEVGIGTSSHPFSLKDDVMLLGSCFVDNIAVKMKDAGFNVVNNPFGTLYNPASIAGAVELLNSSRLFEANDCVQMGAGSELFCSFYHHTSFARPTVSEFLSNSNESLSCARDYWHKCKKVIITLGTAMVWEHDSKVVANCLKRPSNEFVHRLLTLDEIIKYIKSIEESNFKKEFLFTVSPIRHLGEGAHNNTISKSLLQLAVKESGVEYFPAYEILLDELRDYRFYSDDLVHPSKVAIDIIWERFVKYATLPEEKPLMDMNEKRSKASKHVRRI